MNVLATMVLLIIASSAWAAEEFAHIKCVSRSDNNGSTHTVAEGFMVYDNAQLTIGADGIQVRGRWLTTKQSQIADATCRDTYYEYETCLDSSCDSLSSEMRRRNWNALSIVRSPTVTILSCGSSSVVNIYDDKADFIADFSKTKVKTLASCPWSASYPTSCGLDSVEHAGCLTSL